MSASMLTTQNAVSLGDIDDTQALYAQMVYENRIAACWMKQLSDATAEVRVVHRNVRRVPAS